MNDKELEQQAKQALDKSTQTLSPELRQRLYEARQTALSKREKPWFKQPFVGFAVAASFSAVLLVNYLPQDPLQNEQMPDQIADNTVNNSALNDLMFIASFDDIDMEIAEDIEFAYWLSEQLENESSTETLSNGELRNG